MSVEFDAMMFAALDGSRGQEEQLKSLLAAVESVARSEEYKPTKTLPSGQWGAFDPNNATERGRRLHAVNYGRVHWLLSLYSQLKQALEAGGNFPEVIESGRMVRRWLNFHWDTEPRKYELTRSNMTRIANGAAWIKSGMPEHRQARDAA